MRLAILRLFRPRTRLPAGVCARKASCPGSCHCMASAQDQRLVYCRTRSTETRAEVEQQLLEAGKALQRPGTDPSSVAFTFEQPTTSSPNLPSFDADLYIKHLSSQELGCTVLTAASLPSTQTLLQSKAGRLPDGLVCVVDRQEAGKGRGGNAWTSPEGCLMFSLSKVLTIAGDKLPFLQYVVSLAIVHAVQAQAATALQGGSLDVRIKWPNDIFASGQKIGGILCHSTYRNRQFYVTVGCGINVTNAQPTTCIQQLIAEQQQRHGLAPSPPVQREILLASIITELEQLLHTLGTAGFAPLRAAYLAAWLHTGQQVTLVEDSQSVQLTVEGITDTGYLLARDGAGSPFELHPDGNSLDFFQGLVRRKLAAQA